VSTSGKAPSREAVVGMLVDGVRSRLVEVGEEVPADLGEGTRLVGEQAVLASLALVSLIVEVEQTLEDDFGVTLTLADERALSQRHSPFRTIGTLADYVGQLLAEGGAG
jgi:acyl carrier protein